MKNAVFVLAVATTLLAGISLNSCQSAAQKSEDAQADAEAAQMAAEEAKQEAADEAEWIAFKSDAEMKIKDNDARIVELNMKMKKPGKMLDGIYAQKIENIEQKNKDLKIRIETRNNSESDWETFKREFNHDMDELGQAFKDLTVDNEK